MTPIEAPYILVYEPEGTEPVGALFPPGAEAPIIAAPEHEEALAAAAADRGVTARLLDGSTARGPLTRRRRSRAAWILLGLAALHQHGYVGRGIY